MRQFARTTKVAIDDTQVTLVVVVNASGATVLCPMRGGQAASMPAADAGLTIDLPTATAIRDKVLAKSGFAEVPAAPVPPSPVAAPPAVTTSKA